MRPKYTATGLIPDPVVLDSCVIFPIVITLKSRATFLLACRSARYQKPIHSMTSEIFIFSQF